MEEPVAIGRRLEPFFDRFLVAHADGLTHRLHAPEPRERVLELNRPQEGTVSWAPRVIQEGGRYRLYYRGWHPGADFNRAMTCVAESEDGVHFQRSRLGRYEVAGSRDNNVVLQGPEAHNLAPFRDPRSDISDDQRYKAVGSAGRAGSGLYVLASADGLRWRRLRSAPMLTEGAFDSHNIAFWSAHEGCYLCYYRVGAQGVRSIARAWSDDFIHWSSPTPIDFGDKPPEHLYTNATHPYFRAPHLYLALPKRFVPDRPGLSESDADARQVHPPNHRKAVSDVLFFTSRGGARYDTTFRQALIRPGLEAGNWVARASTPGPAVVPTGPAEMSFYVVHHYAQPTCHIRRYALRTDGFASMQAGAEPGELVTRPLTFEGAALRLNASTAAAGSIRVEIQDASGAPIDGYRLEDATPLYGDGIALPARWGDTGGVGALAGRPVRLRFVLQDADLYAFRFE